MGSAAVKMTNHNHPQLTRHSEAKCAIERGDTTRLSEVLQSCEELQPIFQHRLLALHSYMRLTPDEAASWLLERAARTDSEEALDQFCCVALRRKVKVDRIACIYGVTVDRTFDLGSGFFLQPVAERESARDILSDDMAEMITWGREVAHKTLLIDQDYEKARLADDKLNVRDAVAEYKDDRLFRLDEVLGIVSLAAENGVFQGTLWEEHADSFWLRQGLKLWSRSTIRPSGNVPMTQSQLESASELLSYFYQLDEQRHRIRIALQRYRRALASYDLQQKVLDLAIAYESLLIPKKVDEITATLCLRGAWLLSATQEERIATHNMLNALYKQRSQIVHQGGLEWELGKWTGRENLERRRKGQADSRELLEKLFREFARLATHMIRNGIPDDPDWKKLVLGGLAPQA